LKQLLNTLYITIQGTYLHIDHETFKLDQEGKTLLQVPAHHIGAIVIFGNVMVSPFAISKLVEEGKSLAILDKYGRFKAKMTGHTTGNIFLRRAQHQAFENHDITVNITRCLVAGKIQNSRIMAARAAREANTDEDKEELRQTVESLAALLVNLEIADNVDTIRGIEGAAAKTYFSTLTNMIKANRSDFQYTERSRRPPRDRINCILSFLYSLLMNDCLAALEGVGLDPQLGFLHCLRPGRPALALDLMEEFRSIIADRLAIAVINRKQIQPGDFEEKPGGAIIMNDDSKKKLVIAYQERKQEEVTHPMLDQKMPVGLIPHVQARIMARHLRGDMESYIPYISR
jgi:CRISP-associated protein Cas1